MRVSYKYWEDDIYPNLHISRGPITVFDTGEFMSKVNNHVGLTFGAALEFLKDGLKLRRLGWNNSEAFLELKFPDPDDDSRIPMTLPYIYIEYPEGSRAYPQGSRVPWLASQTDMLQDDWVVIP